MKRSIKAIVAAAGAAVMCAAPALTSVTSTPIVNSISASAYYIPNAYSDIDHTFIATISFDHIDDKGRTIYSGCHLNYRFENTKDGQNVIMVCGCDFADSIVNVPSRVSLNGQIYWVGGIAEGAFMDKNGTLNNHGAGITEINLENSTFCYEIKANAFKNCTKLKTLKLKSGNLYWIDDSAFENCSAITDLDLPSTVREVGKQAFMNTGIKNLQFNYNSRYNLKLGKNAFNNCTAIKKIVNNNNFDYTASYNNAFQGVNKSGITFSTTRTVSNANYTYVTRFKNFFFN
ncbi:MAG: leucine-rich repeat domain-containing protein [Ruminococcus sp.]|nr:leucine-rich repeat domain-containing protein [Ruminococcus sp.]